MQKIHAVWVSLLLLIVPSSIFASEEGGQGRGWALDIKAGTLGIGADLSRSLVPRVLNVRVGAGFFAYMVDYHDDGIDYHSKLKLGAVPIVLDVFPFRNWFRLGGGVAINLTEADETGWTSTGSFTIGDHQYSLESIGQLRAKLKGNRVAPYFGIGFNNPIKRSGRLGFFVDLGFLYHGTPAATVTTSKTLPGLQADLDKVARDRSEDIKDYKIYPVLQLGLSFKF